MINKRNIRSLQRKKETKKIRFFVVLSLVFIAAFTGMYFFVRSFFTVKDVVFVGNRYVKNEELKSLVKVNKNDELFGLSGKEIYQRLKKSAWVRDAVVRRELTGRMVINISEAVPVAILSVAERPYLIENEGRILEQMKEGTALFLPVIKDIHPNQNRDAYMEAIKFVMVLHNKKGGISGSFSGSFGGSDIEITGHRPEDITLKLDNISIKVGAGDFDKKLERLQFVKDEIQRRNMSVEYIDLRFANKIIVKPLGGAEEAKGFNH
jgi:cell division protein FtsQ